MSYRLKFDPDKCVGCYACHIACLDAHHDVEDVDAKSYRTVKKVVKISLEKISVRAVLTAVSVSKPVRCRQFTKIRRLDLY